MSRAQHSAQITVLKIVSHQMRLDGLDSIIVKNATDRVCGAATYQDKHFCTEKDLWVQRELCGQVWSQDYS